MVFRAFAQHLGPACRAALLLAGHAPLVRDPGFAFWADAVTAFAKAFAAFVSRHVVLLSAVWGYNPV
jgi:hypothetical protein